MIPQALPKLGSYRFQLSQLGLKISLAMAIPLTAFSIASASLAAPVNSTHPLPLAPTDVSTLFPLRDSGLYSPSLRIVEIRNPKQRNSVTYLFAPTGQQPIGGEITSATQFIPRVVQTRFEPGFLNQTDQSRINFAF